MFFKKLTNFQISLFSEVCAWKLEFIDSPKACSYINYEKRHFYAIFLFHLLVLHPLSLSLSEPSYCISSSLPSLIPDAVVSRTGFVYWFPERSKSQLILKTSSFLFHSPLSFIAKTGEDSLGFGRQLCILRGLDLDLEGEMSTKLLEIQPKELKFTVELKKHSSCSVRLINNTQHPVAFKVKTTSPKKYSVRPNVGIVLPNSTYEFIVTMQAQRTAPPEMECKDKFLIQSTIVPLGTTDENIMPSMFTKDGGKYIEENKLKVTLVSPPHSPVLSPINRAVKQGLDHEGSQLKNQDLGTVETLKMVAMTLEESELVKDEVLKQEKDAEFKPAKVVEQKPAKIAEQKPAKVAEQKPVNVAEQKPAKVSELNSMKDLKFEPENDAEFDLAEDEVLNSVKIVKELNIVKDIEEMKSKLDFLGSKLREAEDTIYKLTEERKSSIQDIEALKEKLAELSRIGIRRIQVGFPLLFVCMVAIISVFVGYLLHP